MLTVPSETHKGNKDVRFDVGDGAWTGYTIHADPAVQQAAADVLRRSMRARPKLRNSLLLGMASFASRLPEDYPEVLLFMVLYAMASMTNTPRRTWTTDEYFHARGQ